MLIQFKQDFWCVCRKSGGFDGGGFCTAILVKGKEWFEVLTINESGKRISDIHVWSDGCCDGENKDLLNIPNYLIEVKSEESL